MISWVFMRLRFALVALCCACSSAEPAQPSAAAASSGAEARQETPPLLPAAREATFTQPLHLPLQLLTTSIEAQLPEHESQPRKLLTRENASPAIEASFEIWRDAVNVRFEGDTLFVDVPLRYAAKFDARIKNPFGGKWIKVAQDEDWGSEGDPQHLTLHLRTHVEITPQWELRLRTEVDTPEHGAPPGGKLCTSGFLELCITKDSFASEVRRRLDAEIVPRVHGELEKLDRQIEERVQLRQRVEKLWRDLGQPRAQGAYDRYTTILPLQAALALHGQDGEIVLEPAVHGIVTYHQGKPEPVAAPALADKVELDAMPGERVSDPRVFSIDAAFF